MSHANGTAPMIEVVDLTKTFGSFTAVDRISFTMGRGEIIGFLGPNGAGKTTTIKMIMGLLRISSGLVRVKGLDNRRHLPEIKRMVGYMSQKFSLYPLLTARQNVEFAAGIFRLPRSTVKVRLEELRGLIPAEMVNLKVEDIPPGIRQRVALFVCLLGDPEIILLDEPTSGVDPETRRRFWQEIYQLKKGGKTLMVTTHYLDEAEYADRILIINNGRLILEGEPGALRRAAGDASMEDLFRHAVGSS